MIRNATLLLLAAVLGGCLAPLPYSPDENLVAQVGADEGQSRLRTVMHRATHPRIGEIEVTPVWIEYRHSGLDPWGVPNLTATTQLRWANFGRIDVYENHKVFLYDTAGRERSWIQFSSPEDALEFTDLMYSFRRSAHVLDKKAAAPPKGESPFK